MKWNEAYEVVNIFTTTHNGRAVMIKNEIAKACVRGYKLVFMDTDIEYSLGTDDKKQVSLEKYFLATLVFERTGADQTSL